MESNTHSSSSNCLFTTHMQISSPFRKPCSPLKQKLPKYITSPPCEPISRTRQEVDSLHSLETTLHSLQQTYLRLFIHTTQQFKCLRYPLTTLNISQLQTSIYLPKTARHTLQNSGTAIQHYIREGGVSWCCVYVGALVILKILNT